jgi:hypothetical protein
VIVVVIVMIVRHPKTVGRAGKLPSRFLTNQSLGAPIGEGAKPVQTLALRNRQALPRECACLSLEERIPVTQIYCGDRSFIERFPAGWTKAYDRQFIAHFATLAFFGEGVAERLRFDDLRASLAAEVETVRQGGACTTPCQKVGRRSASSEGGDPATG